MILYSVLFVVVIIIEIVILELLQMKKPYNSNKITRITCDLDDKDINKLIRCLKTFRRYGFTEDLTVKLSSSGNGFHAISWSKKGVTLKKLLKIRKKAGDDKIRIMLDGKSFRAIQVLFTKKEKHKSDLIVDDIPMEFETCGEEQNVKVSYGEI